MADEESPRITVTVKTPKEKHDVEINPDAGVREVRIDCWWCLNKSKCGSHQHVSIYIEILTTFPDKPSCAMIQQYDVYLLFSKNCLSKMISFLSRTLLFTVFIDT